MNVVEEPSRELKRLATRIDFAHGKIVDARRHAGLHTPWEALRHCWTLTNLTLRHSEAITLMARTDVVLAPAAWASARAAMESAARTRWLLESRDVWEREARWLALMEEGYRTHARVQEALGIDPQAVQGLSGFIRDVKAQLPSGTVIPGIPPVREMLRGSGERLGLLYTLGSQYTHGTDYVASLLYRRGLGGEASYSEDRSERHWRLPLWTAWKAVETSILELMAAGDVPLNFDLGHVEAAVDEAFEAFDSKLESDHPEGGPRWPSDREWHERAT